MDYKFKIEKIMTKNGEELFPAKINIILGPNNSGKSRFLKDLKNWFQRQTDLSSNKIIGKLDFKVPEDFARFCATYLSPDNVMVHNDRVVIKTFSGMDNPDLSSGGMSMENYVDSNNTTIYLSGGQNWESQLVDAYNASGDKKEYMLNMFGRMFSMYMGTKEKLLSVERRNRYGIDDQQMNLMSMCTDGENISLNELYDLAWEYFHRGIYFDNTGVGTSKILFRTSNVKDMSRMSGRELAHCDSLDDEGDGLKSFVATYLALKVKGKNVVLIDEPDAFLHPPLARQVGLLIVDSMSDDKQIFVSTHSADLLKAILLNTSKEDVKVFRITREGDIGQVSVVDLSAVDDLLKGHDAAARNALNGLFAKRVFVVESESDRLFYESVFSRIPKLEPEDTMFLSAINGKDRMVKMMQLLKSADINMKAIFDFDLLCSSEDNHHGSKTPLLSVLENCGFSDEECERLARVENDIKEKMECGDWRKNGGVLKIEDADLQERVVELIDKLAGNGIYVVPNGELESILVDYGVPYNGNNKNAWLSSALEKMKSLSDGQLAELPIVKLITGERWF